MRNAQFLDMSLPHAAGALYSTLEDLPLWDQALAIKNYANSIEMNPGNTKGIKKLQELAEK